MKPYSCWTARAKLRLICLAAACAVAISYVSVAGAYPTSTAELSRAGSHYYLGGEGGNPACSFITLKLLILRSGRNVKNGQNAALRYTAGTRTSDSVRFVAGACKALNLPLAELSLSLG